jgi:NhaP-type Na+/H+ or K+/H+ antiporter
MPDFILYLFYLSLILLIGVLVTAITNRFRLSNILFLVLVGYLLKVFNLDFFNDDIVLVLSSLVLIVMVIETTMELDLSHVFRNFFQVLKFSVVFFFLCVYALTLLIFQMFDFPGKGFEIFVLCMLLSIIIYGADPSVVMEFFKSRRNKVKEALKIEGIVSGPITVLFAFFLINFLSAQTAFSEGALSQLRTILQQVLVAAMMGIVIAFILHKIVRNFSLSVELYALAVIALGILVFSLGELIKTNGSLAVVFYGIFLRTLTKRQATKKYNSVFSHTLYLIVFILLGIEFVFPEPLFWLKGMALFSIYLILRFLTLHLFFRNFYIKEKIFMALNTAKGIEVAFVLLILNLNFSATPGLDIIVALGFMFFILSYVVSTLANHFGEAFLNTKKSKI